MMRDKYAPHVDFGELSGLLGKVLPSNLDMVLERKGHFLFGEWKRDGEKISKGQEILLKALSGLPKTTVLVINGDTDNGMRVERFWRILPDGSYTQSGKGLIEFKDYITEWYLVADFD
jgi:hypothetical protein